MQQQASGTSIAHLDRTAAKLVDDIWTMDDKSRKDSEHKHATVVRDDSRSFPVGMAEELLTRCSKDGNTFDKTSEGVLALVVLFRAWLVEGRCVVIPPVEFLLEEHRPDKPAGTKRCSSRRIVNKQCPTFPSLQDHFPSPCSARANLATAETTILASPRKRRRSAQESSGVINSNSAKSDSHTDHRMSISRIAPPGSVEPEVSPSEASSAISPTIENLSHEAHFDSKQHFASPDEDEDPDPSRKRKRNRKTEAGQDFPHEDERSDSAMRTPSRTSSWRDFSR